MLVNLATALAYPRRVVGWVGGWVGGLSALGFRLRANAPSGHARHGVTSRFPCEVQTWNHGIWHKKKSIDFSFAFGHSLPVLPWTTILSSDQRASQPSAQLPRSRSSRRHAARDRISSLSVGGLASVWPHLRRLAVEDHHRPQPRSQGLFGADRCTAVPGALYVARSRRGQIGTALRR